MKRAGAKRRGILWPRLAAFCSAGAFTLILSQTGFAADATWVGNGTASGSFNTNSNWTPATTPTGIATFGTSPTTTISTSGLQTVVDTLHFNSGASAYTFNLSGGSLF